ncbi:MAG: response regulator transcription factor [Actinomycetota bacterium]
MNSVRTCRVLIADDVANMRQLVRFCLDEEKFEVVGEAADGAEAVRLAKESRPDAMILDLSMPVLDGLQVIQAIRKDLPDTKILVLSGFAASTLSAKALALGADAYLEKGVAFEELEEVLLSLCGS